MSTIVEKLSLYLEYPFVRYALIVGVLVALCSSLLGVTLVLKRFSFIGDGLSHVAFGAMAVATILSLTDEMILILPVTIICAVLLLRTGQNTKIKGDAAVAMISVGALAIGYLLMNVFSSSSNLTGDVCSTLFGSTSILTLTPSEVWLCAILSLVVVIVFILFYNKIFAVTFDENFAYATGTKVNVYNLLIAVITAVIIVLAMNLVGSLLISALIIFPALSAMRLFKNFKSVIIFSAILSVFCATMGILTSILAGTPVGSTIVAIDIGAFGICWIVGLFGRRRYSKITGKMCVLPIVFLICLALLGCSNDNSSSLPSSDIPENTSITSNDSKRVDVDLTKLSSTMVYSEVFNMMYTPENYIGKIVKIQGQFYVYHDELTGVDYFACIITDATACCQQGLEFVLNKPSSYPDDYPEEGSTVTVTGTFETYKEDDNIYCHLICATIE